MYNGLGKIREQVINFMEHNEQLTKLTGEKWYNMEDSLVAFVERMTKKKDKVHKKKYVISILCHDDIQDDPKDDNWYSDCVSFVFTDYNIAKECIKVLVNEDLEKLANTEIYSYGVDESTLDEYGEMQIDRFKNGLFDTVIRRYTIKEV